MIEVKVIQANDQIIFRLVLLGDLLHQGHDFVEVFTALEMHEDKNIFVVVVINLIEILMDDSCQSIDSWLIWNWLGSFELLSCASFMSG